MGQYDRAEEVLAPHGCACALRKAMLDRIGGFDEDFFCYLEDLDLGVRGQLAGWKCWYVPSTRVRHRKSATAGNYSVFKAYHVERNRLYCLWKWMPRFLRVRLAALHAEPLRDAGLRRPHPPGAVGGIRQGVFARRGSSCC